MTDAGYLLVFQLGVIALLLLFWTAVARIVPVAPHAAESAARQKTYAWLMALAVTVTAAHFAILAIRRHHLFLTFGYDLGTMDQTIWNTAHGRWLQYSSPEGPIVTRPLAGRIELVYLPLALLYRLLPGPETLLGVQSLALALGGWPAFLLARQTSGSSAVAFALGVNYLLHPGVRGTNLHAFHASALAVPFMLLACHHLERQEWRRMFVFAGAALLCREEMGVFAAGLGAYAWIRHRQYRWGGGLVLFGLLWLAFAWLLLPRLGNATGLLASVGGEGNPMLGRLAHGPAGLVRYYMQWPAAVPEDLLTVDNLFYLATLLGPLGFVPLLAPGALLMAAPVLIVYLLSGWVEMTQVDKHYSANVIPVILYAGALGAKCLSKSSERSQSLLTGLLITLGFFYAWFPPTRMKVVQRPLWPARHLWALRFGVNTVPEDIAVRSDQHIMPHLTRRQRAYAWVTGQATDWTFYDGLEPVLWDGFLTPKNPQQPVFMEMRRPDPERTSVWEGDGVFVQRKLNPEAREMIVPFQHLLSPESVRRPLFVASRGETLVDMSAYQHRVRYGVMLQLHLCWNPASLRDGPPLPVIGAFVVDCGDKRLAFRRRLDPKISACDQFLIHLPQSMLGQHCRLGMAAFRHGPPVPAAIVRPDTTPVPLSMITGLRWLRSFTLGSSGS